MEIAGFVVQLVYHQITFDFLLLSQITSMEIVHRPTSDYYNQNSERLEYRAAVEEDSIAWNAFFDDPAPLRFLGMNYGPYKDLSAEERSEKWILRIVERANLNQFGQLVVLEKETKRIVGLAGIIQRTEDGVEGELEIAYSLLPEARGKGYGSEAAIHFKNWAFENTEVPSVISVIHVDNEASMNVARKNGMVPERTFEFFGMPVHLFRVRRN